MKMGRSLSTRGPSGKEKNTFNVEK
jgi:hypothetical protein